MLFDILGSLVECTKIVPFWGDLFFCVKMGGIEVVFCIFGVLLRFFGVPLAVFGGRIFDRGREVWYVLI